MLVFMNGKKCYGAHRGDLAQFAKAKQAMHNLDEEIVLYVYKPQSDDEAAVLDLMASEHPGQKEQQV